MTFCFAAKVDEGVVTLADTRIVRGSEVATKFKLSELEIDGGSVVTMTSGLRSVRDKVIARLELSIQDGELKPRRLHQLATAFGDALRQVRLEDGESLGRGGLTFNMNALIAGRLSDDRDPTVLHVYPEGNWIEVAPEAPYFIIGRSYYGKPIVDRLLSDGTPLREAITLAYLAFDATRASVTDVDFPIDIAVLRTDSTEIRQIRLDTSDMAEAHGWWSDQLASSVHNMPSGWSDPLLMPDHPLGEPR